MMLNASADRTTTLPRPVPLSDRENEVLDLVVDGMTNRAAARRLGISERTVREHIARIFLKLQVGSRVEAAVVATERRLAAKWHLDLDRSAA